MASEPYLTTLRELARCFQAFQSYSAVHIRGVGLTPAQFDIIATLGNTDGMSFKELGNRTLITKGTLTGVVNRLEARHLVRRAASRLDRRSHTVRLTPQGETLFQRIFPEHLVHLKAAFGRLDAAELAGLENSLRRLRQAFDDVRPGGDAALPSAEFTTAEAT